MAADKKATFGSDELYGIATERRQHFYGFDSLVVRQWHKSVKCKVASFWLLKSVKGGFDGLID
jgi:hypothetical protein